TFRQTGLQDQDEEFRDYGVVLRPELSNLRIATLMFGLPVSDDSRLTLGYHRFRQVDAAPFLRDAGIDAEPTGQAKEIGEEFSLALHFQEWEDLEMEVITGRFTAGRAYDAGAGEHTDRLFFKLTYEF
ncbi:MAG: alginate export family protein, partial [Candidatus Competibacteraceae bacterium]|nr:alginate export family protein [Candidatus Competibacteraceae bacterium]